jgi:hypothetical protein
MLEEFVPLPDREKPPEYGWGVDLWRSLFEN